MLAWTDAGAVQRPETLQIRVQRRYPGRVRAGAPEPGRSLSLAEVSLENLRAAFDGAEIVESDAIRLLSLGGMAVVREHSVLVQGPGPGGAQRDFFVYRAVIETHDPLIIARETPQRLPLTFRLLPELSLPEGERVMRISER